MTTNEQTPPGEGAEPNASPVLLRSINLSNFLSFGLDGVLVDLGPINLLIGPNGSGKSNLIEAISVLRATPTNLQEVLRKGGGVQEWIWKGESYLPGPHLDAWFQNLPGKPDLLHTLGFTASDQKFRLLREWVRTYEGVRDTESVQYFSNSPPDPPQLRINNTLSNLSPQFDPNESILSQRYDPDQYPEISHLADQYRRIRIYREWAFGRNTIFRAPQRADMRNDYLEEDFSNLGLFLNRLRRNPEAKSKILAHLRDLYEGVDDFDISIEGGTVQVFLTEGTDPKYTIPATRLSDGTLRYLCLLAILCDPNPPPLICLEEPELGLHPDILSKIAQLLREASKRSQLIVTTHSDILVDAMTEHPEAVLVCEKHAGQTRITRLSKEDLEEWLTKYRLGELWIRGELGGTRW